MGITRGADRDLRDLMRQTGIDLSDLPPIMDTRQVAALLGSSADALAQNRYSHPETAIPYVRFGRLIRYLRVDVIEYLIANRVGGVGL